MTEQHSSQTPLNHSSLTDPASSAQAESSSQTATSADSASALLTGSTPLQVSVQGMRCMSCAGKVEQLVLAQPGVLQARVDLLGERLHLQVAADFTAAGLVDALAVAGYQVPVITLRFDVSPLRCAGCARKVITKALSVAGVVRADVDVLSKQLHLTASSTAVIAALTEQLAALGYVIAPVDGVGTDIETASAIANSAVAASAEIASNEIASKETKSIEIKSSAACELMPDQAQQHFAASPSAPNTSANTSPTTSPSTSINTSPNITPNTSPNKVPNAAAGEPSTSSASTMQRPQPTQAVKATRRPTDPPLWQVVLAFVLSAPLLLPMLWPSSAGHVMLPPLWQLLLALPVQGYLGARFYRGAYYALRNRSGSMDLLVALGTSAAFGLSLWNWWQSDSAMPALYFESASLVIAFVLLGKYLEEGVKQQTQSALSALAQLQPQQVRVWRNNSWQLLPLTAVRLDDRVQVKPGERVALDGQVLTGESQVDEAFITGESRLLFKSVGATLVSGALNVDGVLEYRVQKLARDSRLQQLISQVEQAQLSKAPVQQAVDTISVYFVPAVLAIALITVLATGMLTGDWQAAVLHAVAVLVIACPCALGLATPAALVVGIGRAARFGILVKDAAALDAASRIDTVCFDKTGTITHGAPQLTRWAMWQPSLAGGGDANAAIDSASKDSAAKENAAKESAVTASGELGSAEVSNSALTNSALTNSALNNSELNNAKVNSAAVDSQTRPQDDTRMALLQLAASLQQHSEHPQAKAFLTAYTGPLLAVSQYQVLPGLGVAAQLLWPSALPSAVSNAVSSAVPTSASVDSALNEPQRFAIGSAALVARSGIAVPQAWQSANSYLLQQSPQPQLLAAFWLQDEVRASAKPAIAALKAMGIDSVIVSGDKAAIVQQVAASVAVAGYLAEQTPEQKLQHIQQAQRQGQRVAMVGDGINDAPALAQANLGVALTTGTQVAAASSGMSLLDGDLALLVAGLDIARRTRRVIWQNLGWAFGFNVLAIPAAALGYLTPAIAGAAMAMSSVLVVSNALRLRRWHPAPLDGHKPNTSAAPGRVVRDLFH